MITEKSPYIARTSFTFAAGRGADGRLGGEERDQESRHRSHGLWTPGIDAEKWSADTFEKAGGTGCREDPRAAEEARISRPSCNG